MTNSEIIIEEALKCGLYSNEQIDKLLANGKLPPIHTFAEWKRFGYRVKKGEHAAFTTKLWKLAKPKKDQDGREEEPHYILVKSSLFDVSQVERVLEVIK